jgi:uncharacterized membrane protein
MKYSKIIIIFLFILSFKQAKSQCADSIKVLNSFTDSLTFYIYTGSNDDTTNLAIYDRWGAIVKKVLIDSVMQTGNHTVMYYPTSGMSIGTYFYVFTSHCLNRHATTTYLGSSVSDVQQYQSSHTISLYPNPVKNYLTIKSQNELGLISIYNTLGELVWQQTTKDNTTQIDISQQASSIYFVKIQNQYIKIIKE